MRNSLIALALLCITSPLLSQPEEGTESNGCEITEIIDMGVADIESLKGASHTQNGLFGDNEYWDATQTLMNAPGTVNYFSISEEFYVEYTVDEAQESTKAQNKASEIAKTFLDCLGSQYRQREIKSDESKVYEIYNVKDEDAFISYEHPYIKIKTEEVYGSHKVEVTIYFPALD